MTLEILSPQGKLFSGEIHLVSVPGTKGAFEIMDRHAPIVSTLEKGQIKVIDNNGEQKTFDVNTGIVEVKDNKTIILIS